MRDNLSLEIIEIKTKVFRDLARFDYYSFIVILIFYLGPIFGSQSIRFSCCYLSIRVGFNALLFMCTSMGFFFHL